jgi:hypothetical protein
MALFRSYKAILEPYGKANDDEKEEIAKDDLAELLRQLSDAMDGFDLDTADNVMKKLDAVKIPENLRELYENLRAYVADVAMEEVMSTTKDMLRRLYE